MSPEYKQHLLTLAQYVLTHLEVTVMPADTMVDMDEELSPEVVLGLLEGDAPPEDGWSIQERNYARCLLLDLQGFMETYCKVVLKD